VILTRNTATFSGGGIYCGEGASPDIRYVTVFGNTAGEGGGIYCTSGGSPVVANAIVAYNLDGGAFHITDPGCAPDLMCCDVYGNVGGDWTPGISDQFGVNGNIAVDPLFCLEENPERSLTVMSSSPCAPGARLECGGIGAAGVGCWLGTTAQIEIEPDVLNPRSRGRWITCYIELDQSLSPDDIDVATVRLNDSIPAELHPTGVGDYDDDGIADRMVKFSRSDVMAVLNGLGEVEVRVSGDVSGVSFAGTDTVRVLLADLKAKPAFISNGQATEHALGVLGGGGPGGSSEIRFEVPEPGFVKLSIYNVEGRLVRRLVESPLEANTYVVDWNGLDEAGSRVAGGVYFLRLESGNEVVTGKAVIVRQ
jgi:predicted outer membrane repeat protein